MVPYSDLHMTVFHVLRHQSGKVIDFEELEKYFTFTYVQRKDNWYNPEFDENGEVINDGSGRFTYREYPTKQCEMEDFIEGKERQKLFDSWRGFALMCPDHVEAEQRSMGELEIGGDPAGMEVSIMMFDLRRCLPNENNDNCATDQEVSEYI